MKEQFIKDGYVVIEDVIPREQIQDVIHAVHTPLKHACERIGLSVPSYDWDSIHDSLAALREHGSSIYLNTIKIAQNDPRVLAMPNVTRLIDTLHGLGLQDPVVSLRPFLILLSSKLFIDGGYNLRPLHQEWPVMQGSTDGVVAWIPLHDITHEHNALEIIPGSHVNGALDYEQTQCGTTVRSDLLPSQAPVRVEVKAGSCIIFSAFTIHGSSPKGNMLRAALTIRFNNLASTNFIERGYPDPSKLVIDREPENYFKPTIKDLTQD